MHSLVLWLAAAHAQGLDQRHPDIPGSSIATENGPGALWVNPANLAFDPDARFGAYADHRAGTLPLDAISATAGVQGLQAGLSTIRTYDARGNLLNADWALDYGTSIPLPERLSIGMLLSWHFIDGGPNYVAYDAGVTWRPLPWFGVAGTAQNAGGPDPNLLARPRTTAGIALRPLGDLGVLGLDYGRTFGVGPDAGAPTNPDEDLARAALRLRPIEGLYLRASADLSVDVEQLSVGLAGVSAGIELFVDGFGGGVHGIAQTDRPLGSVVWVGTDEPGESLIRSGRRVRALDLDRTYPYEPRATLLSLDPGPSWIELLERLRRAEEDRSVKAVVLRLRGAGFSWAHWQELHERIRLLHDQGKLVVAHLDGSAGNGAYYLATACDRIYLHPGGEIELIGVDFELQNLRGLLDLVGVEPQFVRRSEYKGAPETFTRTEPSPAAIEATQAMVDDFYAHLVAAVATRAKSEDAAAEWIDAGPWTAKDARDAGLVDGLLYPDQLEQELESLLQGPVDARDLMSEPTAHSPWDDPAKIALVYVDGAIVDGESSSGGLFGSRTTGADTLIRSLQRAQEDHTVRAVVLRVDSPGGSALASDRIWRAVEELQDAGKPVVVSMGGLAASGGYYVAAGADAIFAEPGTITGSIGVYGGKMSTAELFDNVGIGVTPISRGRNADLYSGARPWDDVQRAKVQEMVDETYRRFKRVVSDGRGLTTDEVEEVARGRVWTGQRAVELGLVDDLGGMEDAIRDARDRAGIGPKRKVGLVSYSATGTLFETIAPSLIGRVLGPLEPVTARRPPPAVAEELRALDAVVPDVAPAALLQLQHPDTLLWMMDPWLVDPTTR